MPSPVTIRTLPGDDARPHLVGSPGTAIWGGTINDLDPNSKVRGAKWYGSPSVPGVANEMIRDPYVRRSLDSIVDPLLAATWDFEPASKDDTDREAADYCRFAFFDCIRWTGAVRSLLYYLRDGWSLLEATDDVVPIPQARFPKHGGGGQGIALTGLHYRPARTVAHWRQRPDDPERLASVDQYVSGSDVEQGGYRSIDASRLVRATWEQEGADFAGFPVLRSAYPAWRTKRVLMTVEAIRHEREHTGIPTLTLPELDPDEATILQAQTILSELRANEKGYLILPNGYAFNWSTTSGTTNINETIERCNRDILTNVGGGWQMLGAGGGNGSYALASTQAGQYEIALEKHARFIADVFNTGLDGWSIVERITRLNYGPDVGIPRLVARNMPTRDWARILPLVHNLTMSGHLTPSEGTEEFIRGVTFMPSLDVSGVRAMPKGVIAEPMLAPAATPPAEGDD